MHIHRLPDLLVQVTATVSISVAAFSTGAIRTHRPRPSPVSAGRPWLIVNRNPDARSSYPIPARCFSKHSTTILSIAASWPWAKSTRRPSIISLVLSSSHQLS